MASLLFLGSVEQNLSRNSFKNEAVQKCWEKKCQKNGVIMES